MMDLIPIFPEESPRIFAVCYDNQPVDEFERLFDLWNDSEYLEAFFHKNYNDLCSGFNRCQSVEEAVKRTLEDASRFEEHLLELAENGDQDPSQALQALFEPLNNFEFRLINLQKSKGKYWRSPWLRLYAIRIDANLFVITGGAIKLTHKMSDREHTRIELEKLEKAKNYLLETGLIDKESFEFLII